MTKTVLLLFLLSSQALADGVWLRTDFEPPKGVFVLAHGLNNKPEKMDSLGSFLNSIGYDVYRLSLPGHEGPIEEMKTVTRAKWLNAALAGYLEAQNRSIALGAPLYYMGFSMGPLIGEELIATHSELKQPEKMIAFAPAYGMRPRARLLKLLGILGSEHIVNSHNSEAYRAQQGVSIAGYRALFEIEDDFHTRPAPETVGIPRLIYINPDDQLVSQDKITKVVSDKKWTHTEIRPILDQAPEIDRTFSHLIIDQPSLGAKAWTRITSEISAFLSDKKE